MGAVTYEQDEAAADRVREAAQALNDAIRRARIQRLEVDVLVGSEDISGLGRLGRLAECPRVYVAIRKQL